MRLGMVLLLVPVTSVIYFIGSLLLLNIVALT